MPSDTNNTEQQPGENQQQSDESKAQADQAQPRNLTMQDLIELEKRLPSGLWQPQSRSSTRR